jgi:hypothetical protein
MTAATALDPDEPTPSVERTTVLAVDDAEARAVRRALGLLAQLRAPSLAPLVRWTGTTGGAALTHRVPGDAVGLSWLRAAGPLRAGHVLAVGIAVLEALEVLHGAGLAHGRVDGDAVLVGPDGRPVLAGTGSAWSAAPGEPDGPVADADVTAVGELLRDLLGPGSAPAPLVVALVRAVDPDPALRPDATSLLASLRRSGRPDPLLDVLWEPGPPRPASGGPRGEAGADSVLDATPLPPAPLPPAPPRAGSPRALRPAAVPPRRRRSRRSSGARTRGQGRLFVALALAAAVTGTAYAVAARSAAGSPTGAAAPAETPSPVALSRAAVAATPPAAAPTDWSAVLDGLDRRRTAALAAGSTARLAEVVTGPAYAADLALLRRIAESGASLEGGALVLEEVAPVSVTGTTAVLRVRDRRSAYAVVVGATRQAVPERAARTWTVTLVRADPSARWRIAEVDDAALSPAGRR